MTVSVVEVKQGPLNSGSSTATLTTTPVAGDVLVAVSKSLRFAARATTAITGMGATWTSAYAPASGRVTVWIGTGATTAGSVVNTMGGSGTAQLTVYLVRGLTSTTVVGVNSAFSATSVTGTSQTATNGQLVIAGVATGAATAPTYPSATTPSGWTGLTTAFNASGTAGDAYRIPTSSASHSTSFSDTASVSGDLAQVVIGVEVVAGGGVTVAAPVVATTTDVLDPTVSTAAPGVTVTAPTLAATTDLLDPTVSAVGPVTVAAPALATTTDLLDPTVTLAPEGITVQHFDVTSASGANPYIANLPVTPQPGDVVVVAVGTTSTTLVRTVSTVTGLGATWTEELESAVANAPTVSWWIGEGATASGDISATLNSGRNSSIYVWLIRGLPGASASSAAVRSVGSVTALTGPSDMVGLGSIVLGIGAAQNTTLAWPSAQSPSGAWTTSAINVPGDGGSRGAGYAIPTASAAHQTSGTLSSAAGLVISQVVIGAAVASTVAAPALATSTDLLDPTVTTAAPAVTVAAPVLSTTTDVRNPIVSTVGGAGLSATLSGGGTIYTSEATSFVTTRATLSGGGGLRASLPRTWQDDPRTGRPQWRYLIAHRDGSLFGELFDVTGDPIEEGINEQTRFSFTVPTDGTGSALVQPVVRECQAWRGGHLMAKGPVLPVNDKREGMTTYQVADPSWYYSEGRRVISQIPKRNLLPNGDFLEGLSGWHGGWEANSIPATFPITSVVDDEYAPGGKALEITGADKTQLITQETQTGSVFAPNEATYISGGEAIIQGIGANIPEGSTIRLVGHTANDGTGSGLTLSLNRAKAAKATLAAMGKGFVFALASTSSYASGTFVTGDSCVGRGYYSPIASNATSGGMATNRRVTISYEGLQPATGSAQFEHRYIEVVMPADAKAPLALTLVGLMKITNWIGVNRPGWAMWMGVTRNGETDPISEANVPMDEFTPRGRWISPEELGSATVEVPPIAGTYQVEVRFYAPAGTVRWTRLRLYPEDGLRFFDEDQATIVAGIAEFMQDPAYGWASLNIGWRTPPTGVIRDRREYKFYEQRPVEVALQEFTALSRGMDIAMLTTKDTATIATFYPRQGGPTDVTIEDGGIGVAYEPAANRDVASLIIAQADGMGVARPEEYAIDDDALDGMRLANIVNAEHETPINELDELAALELKRAKVTTPAYWVTCHPRWTSYLLDNLGMGDTCRLILPREGVNALARLVKRSINPNTDTLRLFLALED